MTDVIIFYKMNNCGYCDKAEEMLKEPIANGQIVVKPANEANGKFRGFPSFKNPRNGLTHSGLLQSVDFLSEKLKVDLTPPSSSSPSPSLPAPLPLSDYYIEETLKTRKFRSLYNILFLLQPPPPPNPTSQTVVGYVVNQ